MKDYTEYIIQQAQKLLSIDSPSGYTEHVSQRLLETYREMGYDPQLTTKGGVLVQISGAQRKIQRILQRDLLC